MKIEGNLKIEKGNEAEWKDKIKEITSITGYLNIYSNVALPKLSSVVA